MADSHSVSHHAGAAPLFVRRLPLIYFLHDSVLNDPQPGMEYRERRYQNTKSIHASIYRQTLAVFFCLLSRAELFAVLGRRQGKVLTEVMAQRSGITEAGLFGDTVNT